MDRMVLPDVTALTARPDLSEPLAELELLDLGVRPADLEPSWTTVTWAMLETKAKPACLASRVTTVAVVLVDLLVLKVLRVAWEPTDAMGVMELTVAMEPSVTLATAAAPVLLDARVKLDATLRMA